MRAEPGVCSFAFADERPRRAALRVLAGAVGYVRLVTFPNVVDARIHAGAAGLRDGAGEHHLIARHLARTAAPLTPRRQAGATAARASARARTATAGSTRACAAASCSTTAGTAARSTAASGATAASPATRGAARIRAARRRTARRSTTAGGPARVRASRRGTARRSTTGTVRAAAAIAAPSPGGRAARGRRIVATIPATIASTVVDGCNRAGWQRGQDQRAEKVTDAGHVTATLEWEVRARRARYDLNPAGRRRTIFVDRSSPIFAASARLPCILVCVWGSPCVLDRTDALRSADVRPRRRSSHLAHQQVAVVESAFFKHLLAGSADEGSTAVEPGARPDSPRLSVRRRGRGPERLLRRDRVQSYGRSCLLHEWRHARSCANDRTAPRRRPKRYSYPSARGCRPSAC